jgi:hypothetical protein
MSMRSMRMSRSMVYLPYQAGTLQVFNRLGREEETSIDGCATSDVCVCV